MYQLKSAPVYRRTFHGSTERLTEALVLAITAPVGRTAEADALAHQFASYCTAEQIGDARAAALAELRSWRPFRPTWSPFQKRSTRK